MTTQIEKLRNWGASIREMVALKTSVNTGVLVGLGGVLIKAADTLEALQQGNHNVVFTQEVIIEDGGDRVTIQKELTLPFPPVKEAYIIFPELNAPYVTYFDRIHYDMRDGKFYVQGSTKWVEVYRNGEYDWGSARRSLDNYVKSAVSAGWEIISEVTSEKVSEEEVSEEVNK